MKEKILKRYEENQTKLGQNGEESEKIVKYVEYEDISEIGEELGKKENELYYKLIPVSKEELEKELKREERKEEDKRKTKEKRKIDKKLRIIQEELADLEKKCGLK